MLAAKATNMHSAIVDVQNKRPVTDILINEGKLFCSGYACLFDCHCEAKFIIIIS